MEHHVHEPAHEHAAAPAGTGIGKTFTVRVPKPNWQVTALLLVALIAGFQTFQLARLKGSVTAKAATTTASAVPAASSAASDSSGLQSQVGGC